MGVVLKSGGDVTSHLSWLLYEEMWDGRPYWISSVTASRIEAYVLDEQVFLNGTGFTKDAFGYPTGGKIKSVTSAWNGDVLVKITGLNLSVVRLLDVIDSDTKKDNMALVKSVLSGSDKLSGGKFADVLHGYDGNDVLAGNEKRDKLFGNAGNDKLDGGADSDKLYGGAGKDTFIFKKVTDSTASGIGRDTIYDFSKKQGDKIDLSAIDANSIASGNQAFKFIGDGDFHGKAGELRFTKFKSDTYIQADVNGDRKADFGIHLDDSVWLSKGDFLL